MNYDKRIRVLYVEDNADSFDMLQMMLSLADIDLQSARSVAEALTKAGTERFDLYLLDCSLPDGNGLGLCRTLRAADPKVPVLFYSGKAHTDEVKLGIAAGAQGYIIKPHSEKLAETITQLVAAHGEKPTSVANLPVLMSAPHSSHRGEQL